MSETTPERTVEVAQTVEATQVVEVTQPVEATQPIDATQPVEVTQVAETVDVRTEAVVAEVTVPTVESALAAPPQPGAPLQPDAPLQPGASAEPPAPLAWGMAAAGGLPPEQPPAKPKRQLPWRWAGAVVTMLAVGAGCAFAVMAPHRTDLPGLNTASDGRYAFGPLKLPTLAPGQGDPTASANVGEQHLSDIRKLLLAPPTGAVLDKSLPGATGWVSFATTAALLGTASDSVKEQLLTDGWRHTAGVSWKTPDGAETKIYLVQFIDNSAAADASTVVGSFGGSLQGSDQTLDSPDSTTLYYTKKTAGSNTTWYGQVRVGDTQVLITFTAPSTVGIAPFEQEADLQVEMLL